MKKLKKMCQNPEKACIIAFFDTVKESKFEKSLEEFEELRMTYRARDYNWIWVNAKCHEEMLTQLSIKEADLPVLTYYNDENLK